MQAQTLRNAILIALAFDATEQEVNQAHDLLDRIYNAGGVDPAMLVHAQVNTTAPHAPITNGTGQAIPASNAIDGVQLDAAGLPWDERIHSSGENKLNADGTWRARRGVTPAIKGKVEAELRATLASNAAAAPAAAAPAAAVPTPPMPGASLPPMPGAALPDPAYAEVVQLIAQHTKSPTNPNGKFDDAYIVTLLSHFGVADGSLQNLAHAPQLIPQVKAGVISVLQQLGVQV